MPRSGASPCRRARTVRGMTRGAHGVQRHALAELLNRTHQGADYLDEPLEFSDGVLRHIGLLQRWLDARQYAVVRALQLTSPLWWCARAVGVRVGATSIGQHSASAGRQLRHLARRRAIQRRGRDGILAWHSRLNSFYAAAWPRRRCMCGAARRRRFCNPCLQ